MIKGKGHVSGALVRAADVAVAIVDGYLLRVTTEMESKGQNLPVRAYYRLTPSKRAVPIHREEFVIEPIFEVMVILKQTTPGIAAILAEVAAITQGKVYISGTAELETAITEADLEAGFWEKVSVPEPWSGARELALS
jgi:hypothetical protein